MSAKGKHKQQRDHKIHKAGKGQVTCSSGAILPSYMGIATRSAAPSMESPSACHSASESDTPVVMVSVSGAISAERVAAATITKPILDAIANSKADLMLRIDHLASERTLIRHDMDTFRGRMSEAEDRIGTVEDVQGSHVAQLADLHTIVKMLSNKAEDAENRQRRNNIHVVGLPEGAEGPQPAIFAEQFFMKLLEMPAMPSTYVVERPQSPHGESPVWCTT